MSGGGEGTLTLDDVQLERYTPIEVDEEERLTDPALLAEVFELQELLEEAESKDEFEQALNTAQPHIQDAQGVIAGELAKDKPDWEVVKSQIARLKYFANIQSEAQRGLDQYE